MDLVSIIIPVYNKKEYLFKSVHSILKQKYEKLEIILIDDGSDDGSSEICDILCMKDERIIVFHQPNQGVSAARNRGIEIASGRYVMFFDADDYAESEWVEILLTSIKLNDCSLGICGIVKEDIFGNKLSIHSFDKNKIISASNFLKLLNEEYLSALWDKIYDLNIIKKGKIKFDINTNIWEDLIFNLDYFNAIASLNTNVACCNSILYHYKNIPSGLSKKYIPWQYASSQIRKKILYLESKYGIQDNLNVEFYNKRCCDWCFSEIHHLMISKKIKYFAISIKKLILSSEYNRMIYCNEFLKYSTPLYRKILKSKKWYLIFIYNKFSLLRWYKRADKNNK